MGTRVNPDTSGRANSIWIGIREDVEIFELEKKKLRIKKYQDACVGALAAILTQDSMVGRRI